MMKIKYRHNYENLERTWWVGEPVPRVPPHQIQRLSVSGDEAEYVEDMMGGGIHRPVQRYYGDLARTIFINLGED